MKTFELAKKYNNWVIDKRRYFHQYPEESFKEFKTTKMIKEELKKIGIKIIGTSKTGVIGILKGGKEGKVVALRADIDALSVEEKTGVTYSSKIKGVMHACGHDCHIAMLLGAAKVLFNMKDYIKGTVKFIFQPAEEIAQGAKFMIENGALENPKVDCIYGMHIWTYEEHGKMVIEEGSIMGSGDIWTINIKGKSCHGSEPWKGSDALSCGASIIEKLNTIAGKMNDVRHPIVINIGTIKAGERFNIVAGEAEITGMNRTFTNYERENLPKTMEKIIKNICEVYNCEYEFKYEFICSPMINDSNSTKIAKDAVAKVIGIENITGMEKVMGSEDFSEYIKYVPGAIIHLGAYNKDKKCFYPHHSNYFNVDEDVLKIGVASYAQIALDFLNK
ncbi:amidohydrolase [Clostridium oceanicum]|uniref:M20 family metallopeptidase n=1 Tax=Clostridium oceanicum TaxID=1543 RepID=A0ABP3UEM4_9CLOT